MKENPKLKEVIIKKDNFVNDDKLAREIIEAQEKWDLDYKAGISCAKKEGHAAGLAEGITKGHATGLAEGISKGHATGLAEGISKGHATGLAEGISKGHATGLAEGKLEEKKNILNNLLKINMDLDTISKVTGLTKDEIKKLKKEI